MTMNGYPVHADDGGPLLPTSSGGVICGKCHRVIASPDVRILYQSRRAHMAAGEEPVVLGKRPSPDVLAVVDLTEGERKSLRSVHAGNLRALSDKSVAPLVGLGLITERKVVLASGPKTEREATAHGLRLARECAVAHEQTKATTGSLFDLGEPDRAALRRIDDRRTVEDRRRREREAARKSGR